MEAVLLDRLCEQLPGSPRPYSAWETTAVGRLSGLLTPTPSSSGVGHLAHFL